MTLDNSIAPFLRKTRESETLLINQTSLALQREHQKVYKFGFGQSPFPVPQHVVTAMIEAAGRKEYMSVQGHLPLRRSIAAFHNEMEGRQWHEDEVIIGAGSKILLYCLLASFTDAQVLLPAPSWVSYEPQADLAGHEVTWLPTSFNTDWKITPTHIEQICEQSTTRSVPRILILNYPSNPTGQTYTSDELAALAVTLQRHNVIVIADEIYAFLTFEGQHHTLESHYPQGVITTSGLSKWCGAGGWRLGYARIPANLENLKQRVIGVASETYSCAASPTQIAATHAYEDLEAAKYFLHVQRHALKTLADDCQRALNRVGVKVHKAAGGFYLFPDFDSFREPLKARDISNSEQLTQHILRDTGVALLPGTAFGMPPQSLTTRLAFVDFEGQRVMQGDDLEALFADSLEGISALCDWLSTLSN